MSMKLKPNDLHWYILGEDGVPELYLDNHMMQTFRMCEIRGVHEFFEGYSGNGRTWFLDFGTVVHKLIEIYYADRESNGFSSEKWATDTSIWVWNTYDMDYYSRIKDKNCEAIGGVLGLIGMLLQYSKTFGLDNERFRVIGTELYFGKGKEVLLGTVKIDNYDKSPYARVYLAGKIDLLVDNGSSIGPMDHKTSKNFMGKDPSLQYKVHEGMTGYVYAAQELLKKTGLADFRRCNTMWMNCMQVQPPKNSAERFKRLPIMYTDEMIERYKRRMLRTASKILGLLNSDNPILDADQNTSVCQNWYHHPCPYFSAHSQKSLEDMYKLINIDFVKKPIWNPETRDEGVLI